MLELPVKYKIKTLKNEYFVGIPLLGHCEMGKIDNHHAGLTIKLQERLGRNLPSILKKCGNHSGLLKD